MGNSGSGRIDRRTRAARADNPHAREELLDAALRVFAERGYQAAGVDEIAAQAGYSKGALYWHFSSKHELLSSLLAERVDVPLQAMIGRLASAPPEEDMSRTAAREFAAQLAEQREALVLDREYWTLAIRDPTLRERYLARQAELRDALAEALDLRMRHLGGPEPGTPSREVARIVMAILGGLASDALLDPDTADPALLGEALAIIYAGLVARSSACRPPDPGDGE